MFCIYLKKDQANASYFHLVILVWHSDCHLLQMTGSWFVNICWKKRVDFYQSHAAKLQWHYNTQHSFLSFVDGFFIRQRGLALSVTSIYRIKGSNCGQRRNAGVYCVSSLSARSYRWPFLKACTLRFYLPESNKWTVWIWTAIASILAHIGDAAGKLRCFLFIHFIQVRLIRQINENQAIWKIKFIVNRRADFGSWTWAGSKSAEEAVQ